MAENERVPDEFEGREREFARAQSISERAYAELLEAAGDHARAAASVPNAPPWRFVGPRNLGGRIIALGQDPDDPRILYVGSAQGGLWRSVDAGDTWERCGDRTDVYPVGAIAVTETAPRLVYFGTGAHLPSYVGGRGLFRAKTPGATLPVTIERLVGAPGATVAPASAPPGAALRYTRLRVDPYDGTRFWAASQTGLWRCECPAASPPAPVFTRELPNAAGEPAAAPLATTLPANGLWPSHCTDLVLAADPRDTETMSVGGRDVPRYLVLFVGVDRVGVFRGRFDRKEADRTKATRFDTSPLGLPTTGITFDRVQLAVCESQPKHVYAILADTAGDVASEVFHSDDTGKSWTKGAQRMSAAAVGALSGQASYDLVLEVAPDDPRVVVAGEQELCLSTTFGSTWTKILDWTRYDAGDQAQHADQHIALFDRGDHRRVWVGNDGGLTLARDLRLPVQAPGYFRKRSHGIYAGMCQDVSVNPGLPFMCATGLQDNGTYLSYGGPTWYHVGPADGGAAAFNLPVARQLAITWQNAIARSDAVAPDSPPPIVGFDMITHAAGDLPDAVARAHRVAYRLTLLGGAIPTASSFIAVLEQHPATAGALLTGRRLDAYQSTNFGAAWAPLIPGTPLAPGGEVPSLAFGPVDARNPLPGNVDGWAGTSLGTLAFTNNAPAGPWLAPPAAGAPTPLPFPGAAQRITEFAPHPRDRRIVAVSVTGIYGRVFLTYDQGRTWADVTEPVPTTLAITPAGASVAVGTVGALTATATYTGGAVVDVTARAAWSSSLPARATVGTAQQTGAAVWGPGTEGNQTGFGSEGFVTGVATGAPPGPVITATVLAGVPNGSASLALTVTAAAPAGALPPPPPRTIVPGSLPPGPIGSVIFDPAPAVGAAATLLAGTLAGVYALPGVPVVQALAIQPAGPLVFQAGAAAFQLRCVATFTDGTQVDVTRDVDWGTSAPGVAAASNAAAIAGQLGILGAGAATIRADRGGVNATLAVTVQAAPAPAPPALGAAPAAVRPALPVAWALFSNGLPQTMVTDFDVVAGTNAVRAATFGLGVFECVTAGGPARQLYMRQTLVEDGRTYPRPAAPPVADDPRLPAGTVALDYTHAFDIRVDAPPYTFFDDVVDGVEFDEQLEVGSPVPTETNYVYVQVHNRGIASCRNVRVHLYAAPCAPADVVNPVGAVATASPASLDAGAPIADFYGQPNRDPTAASAWKRVDAAQTIAEVPSDAPRVVRFAWTPDAALAALNVALLALCEELPAAAPAVPDTLPAAPAGATLSAFVLAERRAALRVVTMAARPAASLYVRDGAADDTRLGGYPVAGRSPDIAVVRPDIAPALPADAFKDHLARRATDTVSGAGTNVVYVRVHNRRRFMTPAQVKVFAVALDRDGRPAANLAAWTELPPAAAFAAVNVDPLGVGYARVELPTPADPNPAGPDKRYLLLALVQSQDATDPLPSRASATSADAFWDLVARAADSDNAAARVLPWVP